MIDEIGLAPVSDSTRTRAPPPFWEAVVCITASRMSDSVMMPTSRLSRSTGSAPILLVRRIFATSSIEQSGFVVITRVVMMLETGRGTESLNTSTENGLRFGGKALAISYFDTMPHRNLPLDAVSATGICLNLRLPISMAATEIAVLGETVKGSDVIHFSTNIIFLSIWIERISGVQLC